MCAVHDFPLFTKILFFCQKRQFFFFDFSFVFVKIKVQGKVINIYETNFQNVNKKVGEDMDRFLLLTEKNRRDIVSALPGESATRALADYFQNFADSTRIKILSCLSMSNMCVNDLSTILGINQTTISHQLKSLKDQGLVSYKREGKILVYYLTSQSVNDIMLYAVSAM
mgnify:FL=1